MGFKSCCFPWASPTTGATITSCGPPRPNNIQPAGTVYIDAAYPANPITYKSNGTGWVVTAGNPIQREILFDFVNGIYLVNQTTPTTFAANIIQSQFTTGSPVVDADGLVWQNGNGTNIPYSWPDVVDNGPLQNDWGAMNAGLGWLCVLKYIPGPSIAGGPHADASMFFLDAQSNTSFIAAWQSSPDQFVANWEIGGVTDVNVILPANPLNVASQAAVLMNGCQITQFAPAFIGASSNGSPVAVNYVDVQNPQQDSWHNLAHSMSFWGDFDGAPAGQPFNHVQYFAVYPMNVPLSKYPFLSDPANYPPASINPL